MPINGAVLKTGATSLTVVGGVDLAFAENGVDIPSGISIGDTTATDLRIQKSIIVSRRPPVYDQVKGTWSKEKTNVTVKKPKLLANGQMSFDLIRIIREVHPENTAAEKLELNMLGGQTLSDADFASLWASGSLS